MSIHRGSQQFHKILNDQYTTLSGLRLVISAFWVFSNDNAWYYETSYVHDVQCTTSDTPLRFGHFSQVTGHISMLTGCLGCSSLSWRKSWKKKKQAKSRKVVKTFGKSSKIRHWGPFCLIFQWFSLLFWIWPLFFQDSLQLRPEPSRQPASHSPLSSSNQSTASSVEAGVSLIVITFACRCVVVIDAAPKS